MEQMGIEEEYRSMKKKGRHFLRRLLVLFYLFLLCYVVLGYLVLTVVLEHQEWQQLYLMKAIGMMVLWWMIVCLLWQFRKIGKWLFYLCSIISCYVIIDIKELVSIPQPDATLSLLQYLYAILIVLKVMLSIACSIKLYSDSSIRCIWNRKAFMNKNTQEDVSELQIPFQPLYDTMEQDIPFQLDQKEVTLRLKEDNKLALAARKRIRGYTILLIVLCFGGLFLFYLFLGLLRMKFTEDIGLAYTQRMVLLSTLFSILAWLLPMTMMFLYQKGSKFSFAISWVAELFHLLYTIPSIAEVITTQRYSIFSLSMLLTIEISRYLCFYIVTKKILNDPFIEQYWSTYLKNTESYE